MNFLNFGLISLIGYYGFEEHIRPFQRVKRESYWTCGGLTNASNSKYTLRSYDKNVWFDFAPSFENSNGCRVRMDKWHVFDTNAHLLTQEEETKNRIAFFLRKNDIPFALEVCGLQTRKYRFEDTDYYTYDDDFKKVDLEVNQMPIYGVQSEEIDLSNLTLDEINTKICYNWLAKLRGVYNVDFLKDKFSYRFQVYSARCTGEKREAFLAEVESQNKKQ